MPAKRMFGIKDLFTLINLMGGIVAMCLCVDGKPFEAGIAIMVGYLCGDTLDGYVARKLGTQNDFGAELDTIADHTSHVIAPAVVVYTVYANNGHDPELPNLLPAPWNQILAIFLAASIIVSVSIRHARNIVKPISYKGIWSGLPRSVYGFIAIGYVNASLAPHFPGGWWIGVVLMPLMSIISLTYLPFPSHHIRRSFFWYVNVVVILVLLITIAFLILRPEFFFDFIFFIMVGYCFSGWMSLTPQERRDYREVVREGKARTQASAG